MLLKMFIYMNQTLVWFYVIYNFIISLFSWYKRKEQPLENFKPVIRFAVIIAAHNEANVLGELIKNLRGLDYPDELYDVLVVADNCADNTAQVAAQNGAIVYERKDPDNGGKGYALKWMFQRILEGDKEYDAVCIFDADNLVHKDFLLHMNKRLLQGYKVVQGYIESKNSSDTWITANYSINFWIGNRVCQLPRSYIGLSCYLMGTGSVISADILQRIGWNPSCLTEDLEFTLKLILSGTKVAWAHDAITYDERPVGFMQSIRQRIRWLQGQSYCICRYMKALIVRAATKRDRVAFDAVMYILQPFFIVLQQIILLVSTLYAIPVLLQSRSYMVFHFSFDPKNFLLFVLPFIIIFFEGKLFSKVTFYIITVPIFSYTWVYVTVVGFLKRNHKEWVHTKHTRIMTIDEMNQQ